MRGIDTSATTRSGSSAQRLLDERGAVGHGAHHLDRRLEHAAEGLEQQHVVVGEQDARGVRTWPPGS